MDVWEDATIKLPLGPTVCSMESGCGLISSSSNTILKSLSVDGKSAKRQIERIRQGVLCNISLGDAKNVMLENRNISYVLGIAVTAQSKSEDVTFRSCVIDIPGFRLLEDRAAKELVSIEQSEIKSLEASPLILKQP